MTNPSKAVEAVKLEATEIAMGHGKVDVGPIHWRGRTGLILHPRKLGISIGEPGTLQDQDYWPVAGDVVIWIDDPAGAAVIISELSALTLPPSSIKPDEADVERVVAEAVWSAEIDGAPGYTMKMRLSWDEAFRIARATIKAMPTRPDDGEVHPIPMLLFCPNCGVKHVDEPEPGMVRKGVGDEPWTNPPHRSHLCHACYTIWRPADVPTNGVARIATTGKADTINLNEVSILTRPAGGEEVDWCARASDLTLREIDGPAPVRSEAGIGVEHASWMLSEIVAGKISGRKAHRWLGYAQGLLVSEGWLLLDVAKRANKQASDEAAITKPAALPKEGPYNVAEATDKLVGDIRLIVGDHGHVHVGEVVSAIGRFVERLSSLPVSGEVGGPLAEISAERRRQVEAEGWTPEHDDEHRNGDLAVAAACYAVPDRVYWPSPRPGRRGTPIEYANVLSWPWEDAWWKPKSRREDLIRSAALAVAEIERLDRAALNPQPQEGE